MISLLKLKIYIMLKYKFINSKTAPYKFLIEPLDKKGYKGTKAQMHLDTPYVRMWVDTKERYFLFLFDKHKNHISWEQRKKEIENIPVEEKVFDDGYKVVRKREVKIVDDEDGREYIVDTLYLNDEFQTSKTEIEFFPMDKIYMEYTNVRKSQDEYRKKRETNQALYLDFNTSKEKKIEILYEEVACQTAMLAYHFMARDSDELFDMRDYKKYLEYYYSKVPDVEENYIEYLKAYFAALRENVIDDIEGKKELEIIKQKCKEANLLEIFYGYMKNDKSL